MNGTFYDNKNYHVPLIVLFLKIHKICYRSVVWEFGFGLCKIVDLNGVIYHKITFFKNRNRNLIYSFAS